MKRTNRRKCNREVKKYVISGGQSQGSSLAKKYGVFPEKASVWKVGIPKNCNGRFSAVFCLEIPDVGDFSSFEYKMHSGIGGELKKSGTGGDSLQIFMIPVRYVNPPQFLSLGIFLAHDQTGCIG